MRSERCGVQGLGVWGCGLRVGGEVLGVKGCNNGLGQHARCTLEPNPKTLSPEP